MLETIACCSSCSRLAPKRHPDTGLLALRQRAHQQQVGHIGADDQHDEGRGSHQQLECPVVNQSHNVDARFGRGKFGVLAVDLRPLIRLHLRAAAVQPLPQLRIQLRIDLSKRRAGSERPIMSSQ